MYAGVFSLNGNGELSGCHWIEESGLLTTPIALTNTHSLGIVRDAMIGYYARLRKTDGSSYWMLPVVGETWDGWLSDINGMHVRPEHLCAALDSAASGPVAEGCVGGGTGMILHEFKGGIGTSSRRAPRGARRLHRGRAHPGQLRQARGSAHQRRARGQAYPHLAHPRQGTGAPAPRPKRTARSSSSSPRTPRSPRTSASGWPAAPGSASGAPGASPSTDRETFSSPFPPPTGLAATPGRPPGAYRAHPVARVHGPPLQSPRSKPRTRPSSTPCARRRTRTASSGGACTRCRSTRCAVMRRYESL